MCFFPDFNSGIADYVHLGLMLFPTQMYKVGYCKLDCQQLQAMKSVYLTIVPVAVVYGRCTYIIFKIAHSNCALRKCSEKRVKVENGNVCFLDYMLFRHLIHLIHTVSEARLLIFWTNSTSITGSFFVLKNVMIEFERSITP